MKECISCGKVLDKSNFSLKKSSKDGVQCKCKNCTKIYDLQRSRTRHGVVSQMYKDQKKSSKKRKQPMPAYSAEWLEGWLYGNGFERLFRDWVASGYEMHKKPSVDRIDVMNSYTKNNIQLMTWGENKLKGHEEIKILNGKKINCYSYDKDKFICCFDSIQIASDTLSLDRSTVGMVANGKLKQTKGYVFTFNNADKRRIK
jgi:hypothetical protein